MEYEEFIKAVKDLEKKYNCTCNKNLNYFEKWYIHNPWIHFNKWQKLDETWRGDYSLDEVIDEYRTFLNQ